MRNRFKLMAAALLLLPIIQACGDTPPPPPPTGSVDGMVSIEGQGIDAVSVTLSNGTSATTANGGMYRFDGLEAGTYTVTISNYPDDASFNQTSSAATITTDGETVTVNFPGTYIRTSSIMGTVTVENDGLSGITVKLSGVSDSETLTDASGQYAFAGLRAGNYTVEITGFDDEDVAFGSTSSAATVAVGESKVVSFEGTYLRTSGIVGQITADEQPQEGITVSLQGRGESQTVSTNASGQFSFEQLRRGDYSVVISGYDTDEVSFAVTSKSVTVAYGETANVPFEGILLRTAGIEGTVTVEGVGPIAGVTVAISGEGDSKDATTDHMGAYAFENLRAGEYSVVISGFDDDEYGFPDGTSATVTVELKDTETVPFEGIMLRTAAIEGTVTVGDDGAPLPGVMVTVSGGPRDEEHSTTTNGDGMYMVENLHAGTYSVTISGYDTREYGFDPTTKTLTVGLRDTGEAAFQGDLLRTAGVSGRVHVDGMGLGGVTVTLTGEESREGNTDADGQYGFSGLAAGDYTVTISGWDEVEYAFEPTMDITLELDESMSGVNFSGKALRTATVMGTVTVEGDALAGIAVTLIRVLSATSGEVMGAMATDEDGGYSFGPLLAGAYQVMIAGYADEHAFADGTTQTAAVMTDGTAEVNFKATIIRTAGVSGMVTVDGEAMADVEVTLSGGEQPEDGTTMKTDEDGGYSFLGLRKGDYTVSIANPDAEAYSFPSTSQSLNLSVGQNQMGVSFAGARLKQASISGQVHAEGDPIEGVTVTLSGDADGEDMTDANGEYNFPGLAGGNYMVSITNPKPDAYVFDKTEVAVEGLGTDAFEVVDFPGKHTRTASIGGKLFIDAGDEPVLDLDDALPMGAPGLPITLLGPELTSDPQLGFASRQGMYEFDGLRAGTYVVSVDVETKIPLPSGDTTTVKAVLAMLGYEYTGKNLYNVTVAAAETSGDNNLPFEIITQTINVGAVMGTAGPNGASETVVAGVTLSLYATTEANARLLGTGTTDSTGVATIHFPRAIDFGPGGTDNDHLVFATVDSTGHDDLVVSDNADIEIQYEATDRVSQALAAVRLLNNRANFQWWIKSDEDAKDGNEFLAGWKVVLGSDTIATGADGKGSYSGVVELGDKPATMTVMADTTQADSLTLKEKWGQSAALTYTHNPLALPAMNADSLNDLGPIHITFETQRLVIGVYREADDEEGYTDFRSGLPRGDHRPHADVAKELKIELLARDERNRLRRYRWGEDKNKDGEPDKEGYASPGSNGLATFTGIPADAELTVRFHIGSSARKQVDYGYDEIETFGDDLNIGPTVGAFGEMAGAGPEVRMCSASDDTNADATKDEWCATFGYVWMTGEVSGNVGDQKDHVVEVEPETGHGAVEKDAKTDKDGNYSITGLQDGEYSATASGQGDYSVDGAPTQKGKVVYHDEFADNKDEDKADSAWAGRRAQAEAKWGTTRGGLGLMGYVANDDDGNNLVRGDEGTAGITVNLLTNVTFFKASDGAAKNGKLKSSKTAGTTETANNGLYSFSGLNNATKYWIQVEAGDAAGGYLSLTAKNPNLAGGTGGFNAQTYPELPEESSYAKPTWNRATGAAGGTTVEISDGATTNPVKADLRNFGLVYRNGTVAGEVNNLSGSDDGINVRITTNTDTTRWTRNTRSGGEFSVAGVLEGEYTAVIRDAGFAAPCMSDTTSTGGPAGEPDDDGPLDGDGNCITAAISLSRTVEGRANYQSMGILHVYNSSPSATADTLQSLSVKGIITPRDTAVTLGTATIDNSQPDTSSEVSGIDGTVLHLPGTVTIAAKSAGTFVVMEGAADTTTATRTGASCSGTTCTLAANKSPATGGAAPADATPTTLRVMVTAANGYNDYEYTFEVTRANPVGNAMSATVGGEATVGDGLAVTATSTDSVPELHVDLALVASTGGPDEPDAICAQRVVVKDGNTALKAKTDDDDDCAGERFDLTLTAVGNAKTFTVEMFSEDGVKAVYSLTVTRTS